MLHRYRLIMRAVISYFDIEGSWMSVSASIREEKENIPNVENLIAG